MFWYTKILIFFSSINLLEIYVMYNELFKNIVSGLKIVYLICLSLFKGLSSGKGEAL